MDSQEKSRPGPYWLIAELTYRCPLRCPFCPNPVDFTGKRNEMGTKEWFHVLRQAKRLGVVQVTLSGGEPLLRSDLLEIVGKAHALGLYIHIETSGNLLDEPLLLGLKRAGLGSVQLSFQDAGPGVNDFLADGTTFDLKLKVAELLRRHRYPIVMRCVLHRLNIEHLRDIIGLSLKMGVELLEFGGPAQGGWSALNKEALTPTEAQVAEAERLIADYRLRIGKRVQIAYSRNPSAACNANTVVVAPDGFVLPCRAARSPVRSPAPSLRDARLLDIWERWGSQSCIGCASKDDISIAATNAASGVDRPLVFRTALNSMSRRSL